MDDNRHTNTDSTAICLTIITLLYTRPARAKGDFLDEQYAVVWPEGACRYPQVCRRLRLTIFILEIVRLVRLAEQELATAARIE